MDIIMLDPKFTDLPESADPEGSKRFNDVTITLEQIECKHEEVVFHDHICESNTFIIEDRSPRYHGVKCSIFKGVVVKEADGEYGWWGSII